MIDYLKECPCGEVPKELIITDAGQGSKWANVSGHCCGEWMLEFRTNYHELQSNECMKLAIKTWNSACVKNRKHVQRSMV